MVSTMLPQRLKDRVSIVTGAGQGLGKAIARRLAGEGAIVVVADLREDVAKGTVSEIVAEGGRAIGIAADITQAGDMGEMGRRIISECGRIDVLVNNAGIGPKVCPVIDLSEGDWSEMLKVNLTGTFLSCREIARYLTAQESGSIVNISSINGLYPSVCVAAYNVAKAGIISLTKTLALELAAYGVRVNAVCPGPVRTQLSMRLMEQRAASVGIGIEEMVERVRSSVPLGHWGRPEDVAASVAFLASDDAAHITAEVLSVAGGMASAVGAPRREQRNQSVAGR